MENNAKQTKGYNAESLTKPLETCFSSAHN